jgi:hypothetical protein
VVSGGMVARGFGEVWVVCWWYHLISFNLFAACLHLYELPGSL